jgi:two-component system, NarL family, response regulator DesR
MLPRSDVIEGRPDASPEDPVAAVRTVAGGGRVLDPQPAFAALETAGDPLSERECDVTVYAG